MFCGDCGSFDRAVTAAEQWELLCSPDVPKDAPLYGMLAGLLDGSLTPDQLGDSVESDSGLSLRLPVGLAGVTQVCFDATERPEHLVDQGLSVGRGDVQHPAVLVEESLLRRERSEHQAPEARFDAVVRGGE